MSKIGACLKTKTFLYSIYNLKNGFWKKGLNVKMGGAFVRISGIHVKQAGRNNSLYIGNGVHLKNCTFNIYGNNNVIYIGENCSLCGANFYTENDGNEIRIEEGTTTTDKVDMCAIEGTRIHIGKNSMLSSEIYMATGDGHSVCNMGGERTNLSQDIILGNHTWVGTKVIIGKGIRLGDNAIVAAGSVCVGISEETENAIIGGNPAKVVKKQVNWNRKRI